MATDAPAWELRFRAPRWTLPDWARGAPGRCVVTGNPTGVVEVYAWSVGSAPRQVTARPTGTHLGAVDHAGEHVWWFADTDGDEFGTWRRQPFGGGADEPAAPGVLPGYPAGLAFAPAAAVVGSSTDDGTTVHLVRDGADPLLLYAHDQDASVADLSADAALVCVEHSEHGDSRHPALRVLTAYADPVADLYDGPGRALRAVAFSPLPGDPRVLVLHERRGRQELLVWDPTTGGQQELTVEQPGELDGDWYPDATAVLLRRDYAGRSALHRYDLATGAVTDLQVARGVVLGATARPDGQVWLRWESSAHPPDVVDTAGRVVLPRPAPDPPPSVPVEDLVVGDVHGFLWRPPGVVPPYPTFFRVHGGPHLHDSDSWYPDAAALVDEGFAVVQVNYRGSTGYGSAWRDAIEASPGLVELADVRAVRDALVDRGVVDPARVVLMGGSWGGFLCLLGLGTQPDAWSLGVAVVPVADYVAAYDDEMEPLKAFDRALFGGSPAEVPERYRVASPLTYVDRVGVPVLVMAGENDPRCPIRQVENYLAALREHGKAHEVYRYDAGHGSLVAAERIRQQHLVLDFARRRLP